APAREARREGIARFSAAALVECHQEGAARKGTPDEVRLPLLQSGTFQAAFFLDLRERGEGYAEAAPGRIEAREIVVDEKFLGPGAKAADGTDLNAHKAPARHMAGA